MMGAVSCKNQGGKLYENPNNTKTAVGCYSDSVVRLNGNALFPTEETNSKNATCYEPICDPPADLLEEWQNSDYAGPEPTLENTSYYIKEPDGTLYFYCGNTKIKMTEHFAENGKSVGTLLEDVIQYSANRCA